MRVSALGASMLVLSTSASAQGPAGGGLRPGWSVLPTFDVSEIYDDNLQVSARVLEPVLYTRFSGGVIAARQAPTSVFSTRFSTSAEVFSGIHDELNQFPARQHVSINLSSNPNPRTAFSAVASHDLTYNPGELVAATGVEFGRRRSAGYTGALNFTRRLSVIHSLSLAYNYGYREIDRGPDDDIRASNQNHNLRAGWRHGYSPISSGSVEYDYRLSMDQNLSEILGLTGSLSSHAITYSWTRQLTSRVGIGLRGGPRVTEQPVTVATESGQESIIEWQVVPEVAASFVYAWETGSLSVGYQRTQLQSFGATGRVDSESFTVSVGLEPVPRWTITASPGAFRNRRVEGTTDTYRFGLVTQWELARGYFLRGQYNYSNQDFPPFVTGTLPLGLLRSRNVIQIGFSFGPAGAIQ